MRSGFCDATGPASDPEAPYVRLAVVGLIRRWAEEESRAACAEPRWLLLHRTEPFEAWDPPGGRMETGEDLVAAVRREVAEETGLDIDVAGACYSYLTFYKGERLLAVSMACRPVGNPDIIRLEPDGVDGWRWATREEWLGLAADRLSTWDPVDVNKAAGAVEALWEAEENDPG